MATALDIEDFIKTHSELCDAGVPADKNRIDAAEKFLGIRFPEEYREFLQRWGTLAIGPFEIYGIAGDNFESSSIPNGIWYTKRKRVQLALPPELIVLYDSNGDELYCLDARAFDAAPVVVWDVLSGRVTSVRAASLFEFILNIAADAV
jgi:hypothetical protein